MCAETEGYYFEEVEKDRHGRFAEMEVVQEFWRVLGRESEMAKREGGKKKKKRLSAEYYKGLVEGVRRGVLEVVGGGREEGEGEGGGDGRRKVLRWVPRWRRVEGVCEGCAGEEEEQEEVNWVEV